MSCEDINDELCSHLKGHFSQISENNSKFFCLNWHEISVQLCFIWWKTWLGEELITEKN